MQESIDKIFEYLSWDNSEEIQKYGISLANSIETITPFLQPVTPKYNKNVWENCAIIISDKNDENLRPYLDKLLEWLQDMNWPGSFQILERLQKYSDTNYLCIAINNSIEKANSNKDSVWKTNLSSLLQAINK